MILRIPRTSNCDWYVSDSGRWVDVVNEIKNPSTHFDNKDVVPLWAFYTPRKQQEISRSGYPKFITDNFEDCYALLLDFDNDATATALVSVDEAIAKYTDFDYGLYTSYRHTPNQNKYRMVIPLHRPIDNRYFRSAYVKKWFLDKFPGVDANASIKSLQKHKIPAHNIDDTNYRYHINDVGGRLDLPLEEFYEAITQEAVIQKEKESTRVIRKHHDTIFTITQAELRNGISTNGLIAHHERELQNMSWARGAGNDVHGVLCRIAYSLQSGDVSDWFSIIMRYAPNSLYSEVKRMTIR